MSTRFAALGAVAVRAAILAESAHEHAFAHEHALAARTGPDAAIANGQSN